MSRVVVTGAAGWVGHAVVDHLARRFGTSWSARTALFASRERSWTAPDGRAVHLRALSDIRPGDVKDAVVLHLAHLGRERADDLSPSAFWSIDRAIDDALLRVLHEARPASVFVASSGAAATARAPRAHPYAMSKAQQEVDFQRWGDRSGVPVVLGRIWSLAGPWMTKARRYALGDFIHQAVSSGVVRIASPGPVLRSYLHVDDLAAIALGVLDDPASQPTGSPIDLCGAQPVELGELAALVVESVSRMGGRAAVVHRAAPAGSASQVYMGDPEITVELASRLGIQLVDLDQQVHDTAADLVARIGRGEEESA